MLQNTIFFINSYFYRYQNKAKALSQVWKDRPLSPMETAIFWIEYVGRHKGAVNMKPPTVDLPLYQYLMIDVLLVLGSSLVIIIYGFMQVSIMLFGKRNQKKKKKD